MALGDGRELAASIAGLCSLEDASWVRTLARGLFTLSVLPRDGFSSSVLCHFRGKAKPEDALTEVDRLSMENKILQAKIKDQEMEIKLLKKLKELEGGDW